MQSPEKPSGELDLHGLTFRNSGEPLSPETLATFEQKMGFRLPAEYRSFLLHSNGGVPQPDRFAFTIEDPDDGSRHSRKATVKRFYPLMPKESPRGEIASVESLFKDMTPLGFPNWFLPIARVDDDIDGGILCIAVQGKEQGQVYYWPEQEIGEETLHPVANSLSAFLALLRQSKIKEPSWLVAIRNGDASAVRDWLDRGGSLESLHRHRSPLDYAISEGKLEVVELLVERGAPADFAYALAVDKGQAQIACHLLKTGVVTKVDEGDLHFTQPALWNELDLVRALVDAGADVNSVKHDGTTPLHQAAQHASPEVVKFMLERGARTGIWSKSLWQTALHRAVLSSSDEAMLAKMKLLIDAGEDLHARKNVSLEGMTSIFGSLLNRMSAPAHSAAEFLAAQKGQRLLKELEDYQARRRGRRQSE
jgi:ankyrin repeat protein